MRKGMPVDFNTVAGMLASEDDHTQAAFFDTFVKALGVECETKWRVEVQVASIIDCANDDTKAALLWNSQDE